MPFHALSVQEADFPPELAAVTAERITRGHLARIRPYHQSENRQSALAATVRRAGVLMRRRARSKRQSGYLFDAALPWII